MRKLTCFFVFFANFIRSKRTISDKNNCASSTRSFDRSIDREGEGTQQFERRNRAFDLAREKGKEGGRGGLRISTFHSIPDRSIELDEGDGLLRMHTPDMLINVGRLLAAQGAVRALVPRRLAALVSKVAQHSVPPPVSVVTVWTVKFAGERVVQHVPSSRVLPRVSDKRGMVVVVVVVVVVESVTYKTSYHGQDHGRGQPRRRGCASTTTFALSFLLKHRLKSVNSN